MNEEMIKYLNEIGIATEVVKDEDIQDVDFSKPIAGKYKVVGVGRKVNDVVGPAVARNTGSSEGGKPWDHYKVSMQIIEDIAGEAGNKRFLDKVYWNGESEWSKDPNANARKLVSAFITMGIQPEFTAGDNVHTIIEKNKGQVCGKEFFIRAQIRKGKQVVIITAQPKEYGMPKVAPKQASTEEIPF